MNQSISILIIHSFFSKKVHHRNRIVSAGGVEVLLDVLDTFKSDTEIVESIFQVLVTLMEADEKMSSSFSNNNNNNNNNGGDDRGNGYDGDNVNTNIIFDDRRKRNSRDSSSKIYQTGRRIHLNGGKELLSSLYNNIYQHNDEIRLLSNVILKSLVKAETYAAIEVMGQVKRAVQFRVPFDTYTAINTNINALKLISVHKIANNEGSQDACTACTSSRPRQVPGPLGIDTVLSNMLKFPKERHIQLEGLKIILLCIDQHSDETDSSLDLLMNEECATVLIRILELAMMDSMNNCMDLDIQWRAHTVIMELSSRSERMCECIAKRGGCRSLMGVLQGLGKEKDDCSIYQIALWSLSNLCKSGACENLL